MLGKSVLPRVLVRVTLLLPAHLPVLIGQRVSHSGGCRLVLDAGACLYGGGMVVCYVSCVMVRARQTPSLTPNFMISLG